MTLDKTELPLSSNLDLTKGIIRIPADSNETVESLVKVRDEGGAKVKVKECGSVVISVDTPTKKD